MHNLNKSRLLRADSRSVLRIDITEHLTHVRTVHFALLALCFVLLAAILLNRDTEVTRAIAQLTTVNNGLQRWNQTWLQDILLQTNSVAATSRTGGPWLLEANENRPAISIERPTSGITLWPLPEQLLDRMKKPKSIDWTWDFAPELEQKPTNLAEFKALWNALDTTIALHQIESVSDRASVYARGQAGEVPGTRAIVPLNQPPITMAACRINPRLTYIPRRKELPEMMAVNSNEPFVHLLHGYCSSPAHDFEWSASIEVTTKDVRTLNAQSTFLEAHMMNASLGSYEQAFPDLAHITANYDDLSFEKLFVILEAEKVRVGDRVELFGAKLPGGVIARWGLPLLCVVQLYLLLHLQALHDSVRVAPEKGFVSWIGLYPSKTAHITTVASASILPFLTGLLLRYMDAPPAKWISGRVSWGLTATLAISFGLAALTWWAVWRVRHAAALYIESTIESIGEQPPEDPDSGAASNRPASNTESTVSITPPTPPADDSIKEIGTD
jgi:hypothetical protein